MQNYKMTIAYDGRKYKGFKKSKGNIEKSVQGKIELILGKLYERDIEVVAAVNTGAGVHAKGQVVSFTVPNKDLTTKELRDYLEKYLTDDIIVVSLEAAEERFHSKYQMKSATYQYRLWKKDAPYRPLFERQFVNLMVQLLNVDRMKKASQDLLGQHDFIGFTTNKKTRNSIKEIYDISIEETPFEIIITMTANGFLLNMERKIVGSLIQIGLGQIPPSSIQNAFDLKEADAIGHLSAPSGLCLKSIQY
ncbi:tRNA pseudouridine(38-40) synthase TruA [Acidaminobacter sp. JC074]|uniref:tRNA pseudouridine(38-40) synthase TruA n=1 Tax=Acidaminobacter sp. JC074 TaxID=2530199 RepID=UPI001F10AFC2|nr:tRNA pseudouridine(38-40) synthase TruA [Acidaminobacter sp. JC074]MCH4889057.1 tRNA pseudouridine(38-40) synthase TruA [Acidaminobacter sp. JC074]